MKSSQRNGFRVWSRGRSWPVLWLSAGLLSCGLPGVRAGETLPTASEVTRRMIERSKAVAKPEQVPPYIYQKRSVTEHLDSDGHVLKTEEKTYAVTLIGGFPFRRLASIQGRALSPEELSREDAREQKFRQRFVSMDLKKPCPPKEGLVTPELLERYHFEVERRIVLSNRPTLVLSFKPKPGVLPSRNIEDKLLNPMAGRVWVDEEDAEAARLEVGLMEPVFLGWFGMLGSLTQCQVSMERQRMPDGVWVNTRQALLIQCRKLTANMRYRTIDVSSGFRRLDR